ncbi:MAG: hypothetical protein IIA45_00100 [Bacteroidetes bacterium]|nr:hypothetical protein [Bacteroidota bacterium]
MALASIFLSSLRLVKEYRDNIFKELRLNRGGRAYYFTEATFPDIDTSRVDGLIVIVVKGLIQEAAFFEMKNKNNRVDKSQVERYLTLANKLKVTNLVTVSNEFVRDSSISPVKVRVPKHVLLSHFSWTYLRTIGQLLLFKNDDNIKDYDQVQIMQEVLAYISNPTSGVSGYTQMKVGWKDLVESVRAQKPMKVSDPYIEDALLSWYEEEKDIALLLSRKLGVLVKSTPKGKDSIKLDMLKLVKENYIEGMLSVKDSVSDIKVILEFERRIVSMSVKTIPPMNKGTQARISWIAKQLQNCEKQNAEVFNKIGSNIWIEASIKFAKENIKVNLSELDTLTELTKGKEIQAFHVVLNEGYGANFGSTKKFVELIENQILAYYEGIVQHMTNWKRPAPKLDQYF